jgi:hypothetical protein
LVEFKLAPIKRAPLRSALDTFIRLRLIPSKDLFFRLLPLRRASWMSSGEKQAKLRRAAKEFMPRKIVIKINRIDHKI